MGIVTLFNSDMAIHKKSICLNRKMIMLNGNLFKLKCLQKYTITLQEGLAVLLLQGYKCTLKNVLDISFTITSKIFS